MAEAEFPILLARSSLTWLPAPVLARATGLLLRRIGRTYPRLFRNLTAAPPRVVGIEPTDLPYRFVLRFGGVPPALDVVRGDMGRVDAGVRGPLAELIAMLEGRLDGDALFFTRTIQVTGDSETVVTLRNLVDREGLDVLAVATGIFGPFNKLARRGVFVAERRLTALHRRLAAVHEALHEGRPEQRTQSGDRTTADVRDLTQRMARLEAKGKKISVA